MRKNKFSLALFKFISLTLIILLAISLIIGYIWKVLVNADYFRVKDVICAESDRVDLSYLRGMNIFNLDLNKESAYLLGSFPEYNSVKIIRVLPSRIFVDFIKRKAVAFVKLYRYFALDKEGVLFYGAQEPQGSGLPLITGVETKIFGPRPGRKYDIKEIRLALDIIRELRRNRILKNYRINRIEVASPDNASFFMPFLQAPTLPESMEIKIGQDNIKAKIILLGGLLMQVKSDVANIKYIDLRFKEPVIKFKDAKSK
jgi:cell division septal protein FtsQ